LNFLKSYWYWLLLGFGFVVGLVLVLIFVPNWGTPEPEPEPEPGKRIRSLQPWLESTSDTTSGVKGQLRLCSEGKCCETESFPFSDPTMIYPGENNANCTNFIVEEDKKITVEVLNEDVDKVQVYQVRAVLKDGATLKANRTFSKSDTWSRKFELELFDPEEPLSYYDQPEKKIFSLQAWLQSTSDTTSGVKGQLRLCSEGKCCETERFQFAVPTMIYPGENNSNCKNFIVDKDKKITVEVFNENVEKVQVYQIQAVLDDGATLKAKPAFCKSASWSHKFDMEFFEPEDPESWAQIRIEVTVDEHAVEQSYYNGSRIGVRVPNDTRTRPPCTTNPLGWTKDGVQDLLSVKEMGTCFTYNIRNMNNQLQVKYNPPEGVPFKVKEIRLRSQIIRNYCWTVTIVEPLDKWLNTHFDKFC